MTVHKTRKRPRGPKGSKGGAVLGEGRTSTVYSPPLQCQDPTNVDYTSRLYVSKYTTEDAAKREYSMVEPLRRIDPEGDYTVIPLHICKAALENETMNATNKNHIKRNRRLKRDTLVIMPNGGSSIVTLYSALERAAYAKTPIPKNEYPSLQYMNHVLASLKRLGYFIERMNREGIYHNDISYDNILYNEESHESRIIDLELGSKAKANAKANANHYDMYDMMSIILELYTFLHTLYGTPIPPFHSTHYRRKQAGTEYSSDLYLSDLEQIHAV